MSETHAKFIQILSAFLGAAGAVICVVMAFAVASGTLAKILFLLLAAVFLLMVYPLYKIGNIARALAEQNKRLSVLATRQAKLLKEAESEKYTPAHKNPPIGDEYARGDSGAERVVTPTSKKTNPPAAPARPKPTPTVKRLNEETGEILTVAAEERKRQSNRMTVGKATIEMKRGYRANSQMLHTVFPQATISAGGFHTVAVAADGHVHAEGLRKYGQCDVSSWENIVAVAAGSHHTVGLREDGTCVAVGYNGGGQCDIECWNTIASIAAGTHHTVGLLPNGTCIAVGDNTYGQCNVFEWTNIVAIAANGNCTLGLRHDGTLICVGANTDGGHACVQWDTLVDIAAGGFHTVGLRSDGTCVAVGNNANKQCDVARWREIVAVAAGAFHTVGLRRDGTVVSIGHNGHGQCNTSEWREIVAISAGRNHTIALTRSGRVFAVGDNTYNQCFVQNMNDVKVNH